MKQSILCLYSLVLVLFAFGVDTSWARKPAKNVASSSGTQSTQKIFNDLLIQQQNIGNQISELSLQLHSASPSKGRKISQKINLLNDDLVIVERKLAAFPSQYTGVRHPAAVDATDDSFARQFDSLTSARVAASNPLAGKLSKDPELDRMYRAYLQAHNTNQTAERSNGSFGDSEGIVYRVMLAISKTRLPLSQFGGISKVMEQKMPAGGYVYYSKQYDSLDQAQAACDQILSRHKFRDAFVVAMQGNNRVPLR